MKFDLTNPVFHDAEKAREYLESLHWPDGAECPRCESMRVTKVGGTTARPGLYMCNDCRRQFTVTVGTIFEDSKIPLNKWLLAYRLLNGGKKGHSANELSRMLGITYKSAWFMAHRIRESMKDDGSPLGGPGKVVESDEAFIGGSAKKRLGGKVAPMKKVMTLVERDGRAPFVPCRQPQPQQHSRSDRHQRAPFVHAHDGRCPRVLAYRTRVREAWHHASQQPRVCASGRHSQQHGRELLLHPETRRCRDVSPLERVPLAPLSGRVRLPLLDQRFNRCRAHRDCAPQCARQAPHVPAT